jgi:pimeloyl-ACP methyl ester carboxylesterase
MLHSIRRHPFPPTPAGIGRQTEAFLAFDALDRLGAVTAPTLVLVGEQDILTPPWAARELAAAIPGATLHLLAGGGHGFMWEIPGPFNRAVLAFLS